MPELVDQMYCSQQIVIPPKFPYILKRYCKAAIKTQPYDLLRWSFEYFKALAHHRPPPVKMRLEYPIYSTEGGLTRGCLKVLANQVCGTPDVPVPVLKAAWQGFCLDPVELKRIMCLCEVYKRSETVPSLHFLAVAGGLLTKCLTHTMILVCECLTKEPDGGSAAIPVESFLTMYRFLAQMEASCDVKYFNGYREGHTPKPESVCEEGSNVGPVLSDASEKLREMSTIRMSGPDTSKPGMIAGRQMSTTSGEFVVHSVEREIMDYIDEQIAVLPDPDLKKKKAKPEEVEMIRDMLERFLDENMDIIAPELEEAEEEELPVPEVIVVNAVPGIGPPADADIIRDFEEYARDVCKVQADVFMPRNIRHFLCPPLEKYEEHHYEDQQQKGEELPIGGAITD